ncbi:MAG: protoheme IX farnesyltransferase [Cryomorphaceae bacterium]|nr:MAG: protoheme IX farnesyltransferase [Cryomorphaceae bacterium]
MGKTRSATLLKVKDIGLLTKVRLASVVVISAVAGYMMGPGEFSFLQLALLIAGGFLVTGASNAYNQAIEHNLDGMMDRTQKRPIPAGRMTVRESILIASIFAILGLACLALINTLSAVLGFLALFMYVAIYTPLKQITPWAVFVGAFPGAIPPMLGYIAASGSFGLEPGILFAVQFIWQFPHFWAIAWVIDDDYARAGFSLLPSKGRRDKSSAFQILLYSLFLIPVSLLPWLFGMTGDWSAVVTGLLGVVFAWMAYKLFRTCERKEALVLMFASFVYLPTIQLLYVLDKL